MQHNLKKSDQICANFLTGVNENKDEILNSGTITFIIQLKGTRFYGNIALLKRSQDSEKIFDC